ncbi:Stress-response A/B barrel domain-containing protein [Pleurotus pulmonarius]
MSTTASADPAISRFLGFKFKEDTAIKGLFKLYENLARYVNEGPVGGKSLVQGPNRRFDYMFTVEFKNAAARDAFSASPEHEGGKARLASIVEDVLAYDYVKGEYGF